MAEPSYLVPPLLVRVLPPQAVALLAKRGCSRGQPRAAHRRRTGGRTSRCPSCHLLSFLDQLSGSSGSLGKSMRDGCERVHSGVTGRYSVCRERNRFDPDDPVVARNLTEARKRPHPMVGRLPAFLSAPGVYVSSFGAAAPRNGLLVTGLRHTLQEKRGLRGAVALADVPRLGLVLTYRTGLISIKMLRAYG